MRRWLAGVAIAAGVATSLAACGTGSSAGLSATAAHNLRVAVENIRQAAESGSYAQLQQAVQTLKSLVDQEEQSGDLSSQRANDILNAADILLQDAKPSPSPTPLVSTTTTIPSPTTTPSASTSPTPSPTVSPTPSGSQSPLLNVSPPAASK